MVVTFNEDYLEKLYTNGETGYRLWKIKLPTT